MLKGLAFITVMWLSMNCAYAGKKKLPTRYMPQYASIVVDARSGDVLFSENCDTKTYPASLTKMMTLLMLFEALNKKQVTLNTKFKVSRHATRQVPSKLYLRYRAKIPVRDLIPALAAKSANDAAVVIAEGLGGTEANFARKMTKRARELGMSSTTFHNASGLPNKHQKTTARDMATLSIILLHSFSNFYAHFKVKKFRYGGAVHRNHNKLLGKVAGVDGIKTGYIYLSGFNLSASAKRNGRRVIVVVLGGRSSKWRDRRVTDLIDVGFSRVIKKDRAFQIAVAQKPRWSSQMARVRQPINHRPGPRELKMPSITAVSDHTSPNIKPDRPIYKSGVTTPVAFRIPHQTAPKVKKNSFAGIRPLQKPTREQREYDGYWAAQIGAFRTTWSAQQRLLSSRDKYTSLQKLTGFISTVNQTGRPMHRVHFISRDMNAVHSVCHELKQNSASCIVLKAETKRKS